MPLPDSALRAWFASLTPLDWLLLALAAWSLLRGLWRGLVREIFGLFAVVGGLLVASWNYPALASILARWIASPPAANVVAFLLLFAVTMSAVVLVGRLARSAARLAGLGPLDRLGGALFGFARASLLASATLAGLFAFAPAVPMLRQSRLVPSLLQLAHAASIFVPPELQHRITRDLLRLAAPGPGHGCAVPDSTIFGAGSNPTLA